MVGYLASNMIVHALIIMQWGIDSSEDTIWYWFGQQVKIIFHIEAVRMNI